MPLLYAGIDEAGFGPMLGPLCVARAVIADQHWHAGQPAPDLWERLGTVVCRSRSNARTHIPIADSKLLKLGNQTKTMHPLVHLERGVLAMLAGMDWLPTTDTELFAALDAALDTGSENENSSKPGNEPWFGDSQQAQMPVANDHGLLRIDASRLRTAMADAGVTLIDLAVEVYPAPRFNAELARARSKSGVIADAQRVHLGAIRRLHNTRGGELRIVADRLGARRRYADLIGQTWQGEPITVQEESQDVSRYIINDHARALFQTEAELDHLPVALASMAAKLVRELAMARFNRYWSARLPGLKPTAGYVQDTRRWLHDAREVLNDDDRSMMIRNA